MAHKICPSTLALLLCAVVLSSPTSLGSNPRHKRLRRQIAIPILPDNQQGGGHGEIGNSDLESQRRKLQRQQEEEEDGGNADYEDEHIGEKQNAVETGAMLAEQQKKQAEQVKKRRQRRRRWPYNHDTNDDDWLHELTQ